MNQRRSHAPRGAQTGVVLMIAMVLMLMLTLVAVGVVRMSTRHTQVVNNEQLRSEATSAASYALDMVINERATTWTDLKTPAGRVQYVNLGTQNATDSAEVSVKVTVKNLACKRARVIKNSELVKVSGSMTYVDPVDASCFGGASNTGLTIVDPTSVGSAATDSNCGTVLYEMQATAADPKLLNATATLVQGVEVRTDISTLNSSCS